MDGYLIRAKLQGHSPERVQLRINFDSKYIKKNSESFRNKTLVGVLTRGRAPTSDDATYSSSQMVDARGNKVTHGFILVPATGPYVQQRGVREHCTVFTGGACSRGTSEAREEGKLPGLY